MINHNLLSSSVLIELMEQQAFGVEYQPIVNLNTQQTYAYEALARFYDSHNKNIRPDWVYQSLHQSPLSLFQIEYAQKKLQLENAPKEGKTFINLDQDSYFACGEQGINNPFLTLFKAFNQASLDNDLVVELIENSEINDAIMSLAMIDNLSKNNIRTAIDDVCNPQSMISTSVIQLVDFIKLDKYVFENQSNTSFMSLVKMLINYAHENEKKVILEGVETQQDLALAKQLHVDYVQGFLYRPRFKIIK
jgi:EAL domain-containing protein (putative c-di-GMP-specific phosphodiesterase class I)